MISARNLAYSFSTKACVNASSTRGERPSGSGDEDALRLRGFEDSGSTSPFVLGTESALSLDSSSL